MTAALVMEQARVAGVTLWVEGEVLRYRGPGEVVARLVSDLKAHKADILAALTRDDGSGQPQPRGLGGYGTPPGVPPLRGCELARQVQAMPEGDGGQGTHWWRVAITEQNGQVIEVDMISCPTLTEWNDYATRYHAPGATVTPIAGMPVEPAQEVPGATHGPGNPVAAGGSPELLREVHANPTMPAIVGPEPVAAP